MLKTILTALNLGPQFEGKKTTIVSVGLVIAFALKTFGMIDAEMYAKVNEILTGLLAYTVTVKGATAAAVAAGER